MKKTQITEQSTAELKERLEEECRQLVKMKLNHTVSPLENPMKIKSYRKLIARMKTELQKRAIEEKIKIS